VGGPRRRQAAALLLSLLAGSCASPSAVDPTPSDAPPATGSPSQPQRASTTIRVGLGVDPVSIDPRLLRDAEGELVVRALFDGLVDLAPNGTVVPASAESWTIEDDGLTYRFQVRVSSFHDGEEVTAEHHADALLAVFDRARAPHQRDDLLRSLRGAQAPSATDGAGLEVAGRGTSEEVLEAGGIEVVGLRELVLRLERPDPLLLHQLADAALVPLPGSAVTDPAGFALEPVGNGPFRMVGPREPGAFIRLAADASHPRPPRVDGLVLQVYEADSDREQRWGDLLAGRLQMSAVPPRHLEEARERFGSPVVVGLGSGLHETLTAAAYTYAFTIDVAPFDDVRLRQAIAASIDRTALAGVLAGAGVEPADAILPGVLGGTAQVCAHCVHDVTLARSLFADWAADQAEAVAEEAGGGGPSLRITLTYPRGGGHATVAERIASDLEGTLGVSVRLQSRDLAGIVRGVTSGEAPLFRHGLRPSLGGEAAAVSMLDPAFRPGAVENWVRWDAAGTEDLLDRLGSSRDPALARALEAELLEQAAVIPLLWTRHDLVVHPDVLGFHLDATGRWWPELVRLR